MKVKEFEYGGKHFIPLRKFNARDCDFHKITRNLRTDKELGFFVANYHNSQKFEYSYEGFYKAYGSKDCDVFRCKENGKLYIPCMCELQNYEQKEKNHER